MNETMSSSSSEWMQLYQQTINTSFGFSDATSVTVTANNLSGNNSLAASGDHYLPPKGCIPKPIRRRSRASKRTPVTLLNADAKNFRSLVQQFTGCRRRSTSVSFGNNPRGPVNINFAHASVKNDYHYDYDTTYDHASILSQPFVDTKQEKHEQQQHFQQQLSKGEHEQEQQLSFESVTSGDHDDLLSKGEHEQEQQLSFESVTSGDHYDLFPQGFVMDDVLHEIWL